MVKIWGINLICDIDKTFKLEKIATVLQKRNNFGDGLILIHFLVGYKSHFLYHFLCGETVTVCVSTLGIASNMEK